MFSCLSSNRLFSSITFIIVAFVLLIEVEATINVPFSCHFLDFTVFLRVIKGIEYHQIIIILYPPNSMIFLPSPYVKLNVFDHSGTLL